METEAVVEEVAPGGKNMHNFNGPSVFGWHFTVYTSLSYKFMRVSKM